MPKRTMAGAAPAEEKPAEEKPEDSEPDDPDKISVTRKGEPIGPYSREKAKEYFASGQLLPTDWGWHDGMDDWKPINEVLGMAAPGQATAAAGKSGKGKKVAIIAGIVVLVCGLGAAGYFFLYPMLKGDSEGDGSGGGGNGGGGEVTKELSAEEKKVVGFWDRIDEPEFEKKDNDGVGDYEFFANGEMAWFPSHEYRGTWELKNQEVVVTWTEPIPLTRYFKIDNDGFLRLIGQEMGGTTTRALSPDKWKKTK